MRIDAVVHPKRDVLAGLDDDSVVFGGKSRSGEVHSVWCVISSLAVHGLDVGFLAYFAHGELFRLHEATRSDTRFVVVEVRADRIGKRQDGRVDPVDPGNVDDGIPMTVDEVEVFWFGFIIRVLVGKIGEGVADFVDEDNGHLGACVDGADAGAASSAERDVVDEDDGEGRGRIGRSIRGQNENTGAIAREDA